MDEDTAVSNLKENSPNLNERIIFAGAQKFECRPFLVLLPCRAAANVMDTPKGFDCLRGLSVPLQETCPS